MTIPIPPFAPNTPATNITPFTYRDGLTYLGRLERLAKYIEKSVIPYIDESYGELATLIQQIIDETVEVQDAVLAQALDDTESLTRQTLETVVTPISREIANVKNYGAVGDGVTDDSGAAIAASTANKVVLYPPGIYEDAEAYGNAYRSKYTDAIGNRIMAGLPGATVSDPEPVIWIQKHASSDRTVDPQEWDNGALYAALIKESGSAYGAALTGFARHNSVDGGEVIGVHGRGLATKMESRAWGGWFYAQSIDDAAGASYPQGLAGVEINLNHGGADTGWHAGTTLNQQNGLLIMSADGGNNLTRAIAIGKVQPSNGGFHTGILVQGTALNGIPGGTDLNTSVGNGEAILLTGGSGRSNGIRFYTGEFGVGISFVEGNFRNDITQLFAHGQKIGVGTGPNTTSQVQFLNDGTVRQLNIRNLLLAVNDTQVVGTRKTGWGTPTGVHDRTTFDPATVTLEVLARHVRSLITDLIGHGLIGA